MPDRIEDLPPSEPFLRLASLGHKEWNSWIRTCFQLQGQDATHEIASLGLSEYPPLGLKDAGAIAIKLGLAHLPGLARLERGPLPEVRFDEVDFREPRSRKDFSNFVFPTRTNFSGAKFPDKADFHMARFGEHVMFANTSFGADADFSYAKFGPKTQFAGARFGDGLNFVGATFGDLAAFRSARIGDFADFECVAFGARANFMEAEIGREARFQGVALGDKSRFDRCHFLGDVRFSASYFGDEAHFDRCSFGGLVDFTGATLGNGIKFNGARFFGSAIFTATSQQQTHAMFQQIAESTLTEKFRNGWMNTQNAKSNGGRFRWISFKNAIFEKFASFQDRKFESPALFHDTKFYKTPEFAGTKGHEFLDPQGVQVQFSDKKKPWTSDAGVTSETTARIRRMRKIMAEIHAQDVERDLFILEREAERTIRWNERSEAAGIVKITATIKAVGVSLLLEIYRCLSDYGRSIVRPSASLLGSLGIFHWLYWVSWASPFRSLGFWDRDLVSYSVGNLLPFINVLSPARAEVLKRLFCPTDASGICLTNSIGQILVPLRIEGLSLAQGILNAVLLFLLLQAIRNYFKMK